MPVIPLYRTAHELNIREEERSHLIAIHDDLISGRVKYVDVPHEEHHVVVFRGELTDIDIKSNLFNMATWHVKTPCGTAHCIRGIMECRGAYGDLSRFDHVAYNSSALEELFLPDNEAISIEQWRYLTDEQAALAIENFLCGNGPDSWALALEKIPLSQEAIDARLYDYD